jgi:hypothetical protein
VSWKLKPSVIPELPRRENVGAEIVAVGNAHPDGHIETHGVLLEPHHTVDVGGNDAHVMEAHLSNSRCFKETCSGRRRA